MTNPSIPTPEQIAAAIAPRTQRADGWLPQRQRIFRAAVADGSTVGEACDLVGVSPASAYAFRRTAPGAAFGIAWRAGTILAREVLEDRLMEWAYKGVRETVTKVDDKTVARDRTNHRLSLAMLTRLDEKARAYGPDEHEAARLVAQEFDHFLDLIEADMPGATTAFLADRMAQPYEMALTRGLTALERADARMGVPVPERPSRKKDKPRHTSQLHPGAEGEARPVGDSREPRHTSQLHPDASPACAGSEPRHTSQLRDDDAHADRPRRETFAELCMTHLGYVPTE
jgi:hypothetical protein